jgi:hypothetical protein
MKTKSCLVLLLSPFIFGCGGASKEESASDATADSLLGDNALNGAGAPSADDLEKKMEEAQRIGDASSNLDQGSAAANQLRDDIEESGSNGLKTDAMEAATSWAKKAWDEYSEKPAESAQAEPAAAPSPAPVDTSVKNALGSLLDNNQMVGELKEALTKGVEKSVSLLGREDGFFTNPDAKIILPSKLDPVRNALKAIGREGDVDSFVLTMNRAAESAVGEVVPIFANAIREMSVTDAVSILKGNSDEATQYFERTSSDILYEKILPVVGGTTEKTGVTAQYKKLTENLGFAGKFINIDSLDLDSYITRKALDGLFLAIAEEEKMIRERPAERTSELLQKVFGWGGGN